MVFFTTLWLFIFLSFLSLIFESRLHFGAPEKGVDNATFPQTAPDMLYVSSLCGEDFWTGNQQLRFKHCDFKEVYRHHVDADDPEIKLLPPRRILRVLGVGFLHVIINIHLLVKMGKKLIISFKLIKIHQ